MTVPMSIAAIWMPNTNQDTPNNAKELKKLEHIQEETESQHRSQVCHVKNFQWHKILKFWIFDVVLRELSWLIFGHRINFINDKIDQFCWALKSRVHTMTRCLIFFIIMCIMATSNNLSHYCIIVIIVLHNLYRVQQSVPQIAKFNCKSHH